MQAKLIEVALRVILSRIRAKKESAEDKSLFITIAGTAGFIILIAAVFTYIVLNPLSVLGTYFKDLSIVQSIKEAVSKDVIGSDGYEEDLTTAGNSSLSDEEMNELMSNPDINDVIKKAIAFCDSKIKAGCYYSQAERTSGRAYDCSSLMWYAYRSVGILLSDSQGYNGWPPTACYEAIFCEKHNYVVNYSDVKPGDLLFFRRERAAAEGRYKGIGHVAMYVGKEMMVEAKGKKYGLTYSRVNTSTLVMVGRPVLKLK